MKYVLIIALLFCNKSYSQFHIGRAAKEIVKSLDSANHTYTIKVSKEEKAKYIEWKTEYATFQFFLSKNDTCNIAFVFPANDNVKGDIIDTFNEDYKKINSREWETIIGKKKCNIYFYTTKEGINFFNIVRDILN